LVAARSTENLILSVVQERALRALAAYRLLTIELMRLAGVGRDVKNLRAALAVLKRWGLLERREGGFTPGLGKNPDVFMLTPKGAQKLMELNGDGVRLTVPSITVGVRLLLHSLGIVHWHIQLTRWAETNATVIEGQDREGKPLLYLPDAFAEITPPDGLGRLLVLEYYRADLGHALRKQSGLRAAARAVVVENHLQPNGKSRARFLVVFETVELREGYLQRWPEPASDDWRGFYVKTLDELEDFASDWWKPDGSKASLLPTA
jgi:hypothetical protein